MYTLEQVRQFVAVAEELHFGRAAARLAMTQPPLSRQIQRLERAVGVTLLERDSRGVALTPAGRAFLGEARRLLAVAERAPGAARRIAAGRAGQVRVGFTATTGFSLLGRLLDEIGAALPAVEVLLEERVTGEQLRALRRGDLDLGLLRPPVDPAQHESFLLHREELVVALPAGHPLARERAALPAARLVGEPLVLPDPVQARYFHELVVRRLPVRPEDAAHTVSQIVTMLSLVAAGRGIALVPESARVLGIAGVVLRPVEESGPEAVELHAAWMRGSRDPALQRVLEVLRGLAP
ncbi:LysR family transcriptional regulator [Brachybacterium saurashtrense]|uniref:LysR family transcriptional regulator n=1 Tax=Brachybacterium saurashtrense TaxID=556288 RepID=A0A345YMS4_9MICO|nr:LysR family transcriptional regulator [Brachybacterium saurashtrense]AXK45226.1 LysR family transcriptional regulator [Brachybacterium saurashtrense]RRR22020.1 LysR family transcriptional regulator [Brachybacterium saurashtrense]